MVEFQFLGAGFIAARLILSMIFVVVMGPAIEKIIDRKDKKAQQKRLLWQV